MEELTRIADALERIADKLDMLAETGAEIEQDLDTLAECTGYIAPPVYAPAEANRWRALRSFSTGKTAAGNHYPGGRHIYIRSHGSQCRDKGRRRNSDRIKHL